MKKVLKDQSGATLVEYSILLSIMTAIVIILVITVGGWMSEKWTELDKNLNSVQSSNDTSGGGCGNGNSNNNGNSSGSGNNSGQC